jgi:hypothetical protein
MTIKLTREHLTALDPCDLDVRLQLFGRRKSLTARQALDAGATVADLLWVLGKLGRKRECVLFALGCARAVAHLNTDPRVQGALDATQAWLDDPSEANRLAAAAAAARAAARAADAAYAAADAARAAAYAAADAARTAAAAAAADAAADARAAADAAAWAAVYAARTAASAAADARAAADAAQRELFLQIVEAA